MDNDNADPQDIAAAVLRLGARLVDAESRADELQELCEAQRLLIARLRSPSGVDPNDESMWGPGAFEMRRLAKEHGVTSVTPSKIEGLV